MDRILNFILSLLLIYGYPIIILTVALGSLGLPVPVSSVLLAAGSLSFIGVFNIFIIIALTTLTALCGDVVIYSICQSIGAKKVRKYMRRLGVTEVKLDAVHELFEKWGDRSVFFSRWIFTPLSLPVNVLAGLQSYSFLKFLVFSFFGNLIWATMYTFLGFVFKENWPTFVQYFTTVPKILSLIILVMVIVFVATRIQKRRVRRKNKKYAKVYAK